MPNIVLKFGGSSLSDSNKIFFVAEKIISLEKKYSSNAVCVLSAPADITDNLIKASLKFSKNPREQDALTSLGEQISVSLMAMALEKLSRKAISFNSWQLPIRGKGPFGNGEIKDISTEKIYSALNEKKTVLITGYQAINEKGEIITLGRGGSDLSAVTMAKHIKADKCFLFSDVKGVFSANPTIVPEAIKLPYISYDEIIALSESGTEVRQLKAIEYAKKHKIKVNLAGTVEKDEGTLISERNSGRILSCISISHLKQRSIISLIGPNIQSNTTFSNSLKNLAQKYTIKIYSIQQGKNKININVPKEQGRDLLLKIHREFINLIN